MRKWCQKQKRLMTSQETNSKSWRQVCHNGEWRRLKSPESSAPLIISSYLLVSPCDTFLCVWRVLVRASVLGRPNPLVPQPPQSFRISANSYLSSFGLFSFVWAGVHQDRGLSPKLCSHHLPVGLRLHVERITKIFIHQSILDTILYGHGNPDLI